MQLKIVNTGSVGNCYILETETQAIIIECGVKFDHIKQSLDFNLSKVAGVLLTHEHGDHAKAIKDVVNAGLNVYCSLGTAVAMGVQSHRIKPMVKMTDYQIGEFRVKGFDVEHDVKEPFGFLIYHKECGNVLFLTDTFMCRYKFTGLNNIIIEANYCKNIVRRRLLEKGIHEAVRDRVIESHMSIDTCIELLKANDLTAVNNIVLIHLSDGNSNEIEFKQRVENATGKNVHVANKGKDFDFNRTPF